jgi:hypothetical protein
MILPHFERILNVCNIQGWKEGHRTLTCDRDGLMEILTEMLKAAPFDEQWYLNQYPDVAQAVESGEIASAREHYIRFGYFEGRLPGLNGFDFQAYCALYPDLEDILVEPESDGKAKAHFIEYGYREGRLAPDRAKAKA